MVKRNKDDGLLQRGFRRSGDEVPVFLYADNYTEYDKERESADARGRVH